MPQKYKLEITTEIGEKFSVQAANVGTQTFFEDFFRMLKKAYPTPQVEYMIKHDLLLALRELDLDVLPKGE